ncbi:hypothetical protein BSKO_10316 [Bryopsis sp. KO-2023]|nr:hypothetical protein BSKO_10316 [Bryopsis sp. KO-2023]
MATNGKEKRPADANDDVGQENEKKCKPTMLVDELKALREELATFIPEHKCAPILVRLAWHDSGTYDKNISDWPKCGGANGSIRWDVELAHGANAGLKKGVEMLEPLKKKYPQVSYADLYQMSSAVAIEACGGPKIDLQYGRVDVSSETDCPPETRLPGAQAPFPDKAASPAEHLQNVFHRMGLTDKDIVCLSGAHTLGRAFKDRSGMGAEETAHTKEVAEGVTKGGSSWTKDWLKFDNSYFVAIKEKKDKDLLVMETDACLFEADGFKSHAENYAKDQEAFFKDYAEAHKKLSELGVKWMDESPIVLTTKQEEAKETPKEEKKKET